MRAARGLLGAVGVLVGAYGAWLLWERQQPEQLVSVAKAVVAGVVVHDVVVAAVVLVAGLVVTRLVPGVARAPVAVGAVVLATVTVVAYPVLLGRGRRADNPTVLDRDYGAGWWVFAAVVVVAVLAAVVVRVRRARSA